MKKIGFAITSSYCTLEKILEQITLLIEKGYDVIPIVSDGVITTDTRFGKGNDYKKALEELTGKKIVSTIVEAEQFGPKVKLDALVIAPATGNFLAKFSHGITDNTVTMAAKATLRNKVPIIIAVSTNDGMGMNGKNIMSLFNMKHIYFVPYGQDDPVKKPNSLIAHYDMIQSTMEEAFEGRQIQPVLRGYENNA